jgi:hypothetical protein
MEQTILSSHCHCMDSNKPQTKYIEEVLKQFGIEDYKSIVIPLYTRPRLLKMSNKEYNIDAHQIWMCFTIKCWSIIKTTPF